MTGAADLRADAYLGPVVRRIGPRELTPAPAFFPRFVRSIIRQQVSMTAATAIEERVRDSVELDPTVVAATAPQDLCACGLSTQKAETIVRVADRFATDDWGHEVFEDLSDEAVIEELTRVRGVGTWTAKMQLIFSLGRADVFPVEDLGIRHAMQALFEEDLSRSEMVDRSGRWRPQRSLASIYLWEMAD